MSGDDPGGRRRKAPDMPDPGASNPLGFSHTIFVDYPVEPRPRFGPGKPHPRLHRLLEGGIAEYRRWLARIVAHREDLVRIPVAPTGDETEPCWQNGWLPALDGMALYTILAETDPARYVEVGSGHSTRFARRAIRDHGLRTRILSIDPQPRADVAALCDEAIARPLADVSLESLTALRAGDVLFVDGSHRVFTSSDVTILFLEILPELAPGVLVHVHDVFLPYDYPEELAPYFYSEQYCLAVLILTDRCGRYRPILPNAFVGMVAELRGLLEEGVFRDPRFDGVERHGVSFWLRIGDADAAA
jgi:hypothetical protein